MEYQFPKVVVSGSWKEGSDESRKAVGNEKYDERVDFK
jgi:hypothetical protein